MANLTLVRQDKQLVISSQDFSITLMDTWANQKVLFIVLRALCAPGPGKPLFTYHDLEGYQ